MHPEAMVSWFRFILRKTRKCAYSRPFMCPPFCFFKEINRKIIDQEFGFLVPFGDFKSKPHEPETLNPSKFSNPRTQQTLNPNTFSKQATSETLNPSKFSNHRKQQTLNPNTFSKQATSETLNPSRCCNPTNNQTLNPSHLVNRPRRKP